MYPYRCWHRDETGSLDYAGETISTKGRYCDTKGKRRVHSAVFDLSVKDTKLTPFGNCAVFGA